MQTAPGVFISFEGPDGSGKSTQIELLAAALAARGYEVVTTFEPGGTSIGRRIREIILDNKSAGMCGITEFLLYAADRAQDVYEMIRPAIAAGKIVLGDRFVDSSIAYQGHGLGMDMNAVLSANAIATGGLLPDLTLVLDIDAAEGVARAIGRSECDRIEARKLEFHERVRRAYHNIAAEQPTRVRVLDVAGKNIGMVHEEICAEVLAFLEVRRREAPCDAGS